MRAVRINQKSPFEGQLNYELKLTVELHKAEGERPLSHCFQTIISYIVIIKIFFIVTITGCLLTTYFWPTFAKVWTVFRWKSYLNFFTCFQPSPYLYIGIFSRNCKGWFEQLCRTFHLPITHFFKALHKYISGRKLDSLTAPPNWWNSKRYQTPLRHFVLNI